MLTPAAWRISPHQFMSFVHLHNHSHYSLLDGLSRLDSLAASAKELGMPALALTDHGVLYGAIEFYHECQEASIKPIIGMESYLALRGMTDREAKVDSDYYHLTLLAKNDQGYKNLMRLSTEAHTRGFYYKPRIDQELLKKYSAGLMALSGCPRGELHRAASSGSSGRLEAALESYLDIFGSENFLIELQRNERDQNSDQARRFETALQNLLALARQKGLRVVATADSHYIHPGDALAQDVLVCIGTGRTVDDPNRLDMRSADISLKSPEQMRQLFADIPEAIDNTLWVADQCDLEIPLNQRYFANVEIPEAETNESYLEKQVKAAASSRYGTPLPEEVQQRLGYELDIICSKGFAPYFLMVADITRGAKAIGAITNTRGSAAGSLVSFLLGISNIDPLEYGLPFERFLTKSRPTPPDIDLDISDIHRDAAIAWMTERYGSDKVAQIITFGTMKARAAVRDVGRALGVAYGKCDRLAKMIPLGKQGFEMTIDRAMQLSPEFAAACGSDPEARQIVEIAKKLEGGARHASMHAAAIAITPEPLVCYTPLQKEPDGERLITQYDMYSLDVGASAWALGVMKLDLLGIRNLSILDASVKLAEARHGVQIDIYNLPHPDRKTFALLSAGHTFGVFQLGSSGVTRYLKELRPSSIFDLMAMIALYRPGPMGIIPDYIARKHRPEKVAYFDPRMRDYLERSLGLLVYQEDVLLTAIHIAGYSWEEADKLRKAMGKKIPAEMQKQKEKFVRGAAGGGMPEARAEELFKLIEPFAAYGFGKAHAASYALVSYQTAYMKANFPVEFMAAVMTAESGDETKIYAAVEECKALGIKVLPPAVDESFDDFTVVDDATIRFGLGAIKNLGSDVTERIKQARAARGTGFSGLEDFVVRCFSKNFNKRSFEALVKSGALDAFSERGQLLANTEVILEFARSRARDSQEAVNSLFGNALPLGKLRLRPVSRPAEPKDLATWEKEHLGLYVSAHPLDMYTLSLAGYEPLGQLGVEKEGQQVKVAGLLSKMRRTLTKKNEPMAFVTLEDMTGHAEVVVFPRLMAEVVPLLHLDTVVAVAGRLNEKEGEMTIIADSLTRLSSDEEILQNRLSHTPHPGLAVSLSSVPDEAGLASLKAVLEKYPGSWPVFLSISASSGRPAKRMKTSVQVAASGPLLLELRQLPVVTNVSLE